MKGMRCFATFAALTLAAQPCAAAEDFRTTHQYNHVASAFAGATLKLTTDRNKHRVPGLQLGLGISQTLRPAGSAAAIQVPGIELRLSPAAKPHLLVAGQTPSSVKQRLGFGPGAALLAVGGLAAGALLVGTMSGSSTDEKRELERRQCFLPERELCR